mmetsp:Transcript_36510/g.118039  ORF Transcript_36510/g.118039 Transcript_36510/m.118039 type:complete len:242 (-) Transcript_36510:63-788(-)
MLCVAVDMLQSQLECPDGAARACDRGLQPKVVGIVAQLLAVELHPCQVRLVQWLGLSQASLRAVHIIRHLVHDLVDVLTRTRQQAGLEAPHPTLQLCNFSAEGFQDLPGFIVRQRRGTKTLATEGSRNGLTQGSHKGLALGLLLLCRTCQVLHPKHEDQRNGEASGDGDVDLPFRHHLCGSHGVLWGGQQGVQLPGNGRDQNACRKRLCGRLEHAGDTDPEHGNAAKEHRQCRREREEQEG